VIPKRPVFAIGLALMVLVSGLWRPSPLLAQTDLDAFMKKVLARRDDSWKRLQQYILNERDVVEVRGPGQMPVWGERREYNWFLRDGYFVRSPVTVNGVTIGEADRQKYEENYVRTEKAREKRQREREKAGETSISIGSGGVQITSTDPTPEAANVEGLIAQTREPQFISSAYFLRFKFEEGKYALVGRESFDGHDVLKIEYYPARLFSGDIDRNQRRADRGESSTTRQQTGQVIEQAANKVSKVTLWVEPKSNQIVQYVFENVNLDFLPGAQFVRLSDVKATMVMGQPFLKVAASSSNPTPDVWLPKNVNMYIGFMVAIGQFDMRVTMDYTDYKLAETSSRIK